MFAVSMIGQAPPPPPAIDRGAGQTVQHVPGPTPPVVYHQPIIDPFVRPAVDPFVLPVVAPFVVPAVKPYLPHVPAPRPPLHEPPVDPIHPGPRISEGPHWIFYALVALMAYYALIEQRF